MRQNQVTMEVLVRDVPVTEYTKDGLIYIEGRKGSEYRLRLQNHTNNRILAIPTIDGLSVLDGKPGSYNSQGYIINAYGSIYIDGWRTDLDNVRTFQFAKHTKSYSAKTGQGQDNLGVIALACFRGKYTRIAIPTSGGTDWPDNYSRKRYPPDPYAKLKSNWGTATYSSTTAPSTSSTVNIARNTVGTAMGNKKESRIIYTDFNKESSPFTTLFIYYYERRQLERMGVVHKVQRNMPQGFPNEFCREV